MNQPGNEARITNLEKEYMAMGARIEEAAADTAEELKAIRQDIKELDTGVNSSYKSIGDTFEATWKDTKTTLATKEDLNALETRVNARFDKLGATQAELKTTQNELKTAQQRQESMLQEILNRLPPKQ